MEDVMDAIVALCNIGGINLGLVRLTCSTLGK